MMYSAEAEQHERDIQAVINERSSKDLLTKLLEIIEDGYAPSLSELLPSVNLVDDYYQRLANVILEEKERLTNAEISGAPEIVMVDTKASYEVDKQIQPAFGPTPDEVMGCFISRDPDPDLLNRDQLFILVLQTAIAALTFADEHGYFVSPSAAAEVWSFINGYEGGLDFEKILKGLQVEEDEIPF